MSNGTLNRVMLIGHLGDEVKVHYFEGGGCVGRFRMATNDSYTNKSTGERVTNTDWHNIVVRNKVAEICEKYLKKGDRLFVEGKIKTRQWQDDQGNNRYSTEIQVNDFTFLSTKQESQQSDKPATKPSSDTSDKQENTQSSDEDAKNDLPF